MNQLRKDTKRPVWLWLVAGAAVIGICGLIVAVLMGLAYFSFFSVSSNTRITSNPVIEAVTEDGSILDAATLSARENKATDKPFISDDETPLPESPTAANATPGPQNTAEAVQPAPTLSTELEDDGIALALEQIEGNVIELRGLAPSDPVVPTYLSTLELSKRLEDEFSEEYTLTEARDDAIALSAFDFLEPDFDIYTFTISLLTEQVAGFYDPDSNEFVIISDDDEFTPLEQWTHVHEYVHALQDQHFELDKLEDESLDSEARFALKSLAEGEATFVQTLYVLGGYFTQDELAEIMSDALDVNTEVLDSAPPIMASQLEFPYLVGMEFVQTLYQQGGFPAVNDAWNNLPLSTEHILHPERYLEGDLPQVVAVEPLTATLGAGWTLVDEDILGEFYLREYLAQQLGVDDVNAAATGWGGDRYAVYWNEEQRQAVMFLKIAWDTPVDAQEFLSLYPIYPQNALNDPIITQSDSGTCWQGNFVICLYDGDNISYLIKAPNVELASAIVSVQIP